MVGGSYFRGRKSQNEKVENLYKIIGTRSNIGQDRIKEKYIEKLREFPPETHPEEFQEIRRAYETLKDADKRKEYDMLRKYGDGFEKMTNDAMDLISMGEFEKAKEIIDYALVIDPENINIRLTQAELCLSMENTKEFYSLMDEVFEVSDIEEKQYVLFIMFTMLYTKGYHNEAYAILEKDKEYITDIEQYHEIRVMTFLEAGNLEQAWDEFEGVLPPIDHLTIENLEMLSLWLNTGIELEKWGEISKAQNYFRKLSKKITDQEELTILKDELLEEAESYVDVGRFREADVFMLLASQIFKKDISIRERRIEIQTILKLEEGLDRASKDYDLIPYVHVKIVDLFLEKYSVHEGYEDFLNNYPHEMMEELEGMKEDIARGVLRIKKKYPVLYKEFKLELTDLFNKSTAELNREQRRALR